MRLLITSIILIGTLFNIVFGDCRPTNTTNCNVVVKPEFRCRFGPGTFPDIIDCRVYHYCGSLLRSIRYECPNGFIYNSRLHMCEVIPANATDICADRRLNCEKWENINKEAPFPFHNAYKGYCYIDASNDTTVIVTPVMMKCPYEDVQEFTVGSLQGCHFICFKKGYFSNPGNCAEYYYCSAVNATAVALACPQNYVFDGTMCTKDNTKCVPRAYF